MLRRIGSIVFGIALLTLLGFRIIQLKNDFELNLLALQISDLTKGIDKGSYFCDPTPLSALSENDTAAIHSVIQRMQDLRGLDSHQVERASNLLQVVMIGDPVFYYQELQTGASSEYDLVKFRAGLAHAAVEDIDGALEIWQEINDFSRLAVTIGDQCKEVGDLVLAESLYRAAIRTSLIKDSGQAHFNLGLLDYDKMNYRNAARELTAALESGYDSPSVYTYLGAALLKAQLPDRAREVLEQGTKKYPQDVELSIWSAHSAYLNGQNDAAIESYERALRRAPNNVYIYLGAARTFLGMADPVSAKTWLSRLITNVNPEDVGSDECNEMVAISSRVGDLIVQKQIASFCDKR